MTILRGPPPAASRSAGTLRHPPQRHDGDGDDERRHHDYYDGYEADAHSAAFVTGGLGLGRAAAGLFIRLLGRNRRAQRIGRMSSYRNPLLSELKPQHTTKLSACNPQLRFPPALTDSYLLPGGGLASPMLLWPQHTAAPSERSPQV